MMRPVGQVGVFLLLESKWDNREHCSILGYCKSVDSKDGSGSTGKCGVGIEVGGGGVRLPLLTGETDSKNLFAFYSRP